MLFNFIMQVAIYTVRYKTNQGNNAVASYNKIIYFLHLLYRSAALMFISLLTQTEKIKNYIANSLLVLNVNY